MATIKIQNKKELDNLIENLTLRLGKKISQQEVIDACIKLSTSHIDELIDYFSPTPRISEERIKEILTMAEDFEYYTSGDIDTDLYEQD
ncbi:MAG: hypothetical protein EU551_03175 [Promethearchaeota archaeon]|nr:MAG: hypothetical protein EU551_03175 [Candidatus Lokiarchaeota archaeon]